MHMCFENFENKSFKIGLTRHKSNLLQSQTITFLSLSFKLIELSKNVTFLFHKISLENMDEEKLKQKQRLFTPPSQCQKETSHSKTTKTIDFDTINSSIDTDMSNENTGQLTIVKPILRGRIHQFAFYKTLLLFTILIFTNIFYNKFSLPLLIYFASQLILYGTSFLYHTTKFTKESTRRLVQRLDHTSIFILISGTQSSVFLCYVTDKNVVIALLITTWTISILGIFKVIIMRNVIEMLDVFFYIGHGICVIPFFGRLMMVVKTWEWILFILGGVLYIIGGFAFGFEWPDPWPSVFGFHEIFHLLTVFANICFLVPVLAKYISIIS